MVVVTMLLMMANVAPAHAEGNPDRVTAWNRMTDFFATVGKDKQEKKAILETRQKNRREARKFKERQKQQKKTQKTIGKQQKKILSTIKSRKSPHGRGGVDAATK